MDTKKPRRRVANKMRYQKNQAVKKKARHHREVRSVSRSERSYVRTQIAKFPNPMWGFDSRRKALIVLHDNKETDRILFQVNNIGRGNLYLSLPIMDLNDLDTDAPVNSKEWVDAAKAYAKAHFGVEPRYVHDTDNYVLFTRCKLVERMTGLSPITVQSFERWYWERWGDVAFLTGNSTYTYCGKQLKEFIVVNGDVAKIYMRHESLEKVFNYRLMSGRLTEFHDEESKPAEEGGEENAG